MRMGQGFAISMLAAAAVLAFASPASAELYQVERGFSCKATTCTIDSFPAVPVRKRVVLRKVTCEIYINREGNDFPRVGFYVFGKRDANVTPRHRFIVPITLDDETFAPNLSYSASLSEAPLLELKAGFAPVIEAKGSWEIANGACTLVGDLLNK